MRRFTKLTCIAVLGGFILSTAGCVILKSVKLPPGQEKKIEDEQNAKDFAPGQKKKK